MALLLDVQRNILYGFNLVYTMVPKVLWCFSWALGGIRNRVNLHNFPVGGVDIGFGIEDVLQNDGN